MNYFFFALELFKVLHESARIIFFPVHEVINIQSTPPAGLAICRGGRRSVPGFGWGLLLLLGSAARTVSVCCNCQVPAIYLCA